MIAILAGIALKSLIIAGATLGLLALMRRRSAAERSAVAHVGLLALLFVAVAPVAMPRWTVEAPALFKPTASPGSKALATPALAPASLSGPQTAPNAAAAATPRITAAALASILYTIPAAVLLFITALALARLIALRARADVLVDGHWLSALARAQRRMGFKHGTALLTSNELASPISWGVVRPVILLNGRAVEASAQAEAIIAHELAHVARMDWAKLLLARIATALFWFNPLVWILAREAHQLREETADDAVLAADIADTDYAQLLVGVARHECPGLLLGAHGVAPSKSSLSRRIARVLDGKSVRGPAARGFALGALAGAFLVAAPLAALTLVPHSDRAPAKAKAGFGRTQPYATYYPEAHQGPADLPSIMAAGVTTAVSAVRAPAKQYGPVDRDAAIAAALASARQTRENALAEASQARAQALAASDQAIEKVGHSSIDDLIEMRATGINPQYVNAMRAASPRLQNLPASDFVGMKELGVTPEFVRGLVAVGLRGLDADDFQHAAAVDLTVNYAQALAAAGVPPDLDDYVHLRTIGVPPQFVMKLRQSGVSVRDIGKLTELWAVSGRSGESDVPMPPRPPKPPKVPPSNWDPSDSDPDG